MLVVDIHVTTDGGENLAIETFGDCPGNVCKIALTVISSDVIVMSV